MKHKHYITLREFLTNNGYENGDHRQISLFVGLFTRNEFKVSRKYLESPEFEYLLNFIVVDHWKNGDYISTCYPTSGHIAILIEKPGSQLLHAL